MRKIHLNFYPKIRRLNKTSNRKISGMMRLWCFSRATAQRMKKKTFDLLKWMNEIKIEYLWRKSFNSVFGKCSNPICLDHKRLSSCFAQKASQNWIEMGQMCAENNEKWIYLESNLVQSNGDHKYRCPFPNHMCHALSNQASIGKLVDQQCYNHHPAIQLCLCRKWNCIL